MASIINKIPDNATQEEQRLTDLFSRTISYLRVSLTDQCNLRCLYCTPKTISEKLACDELLRYEELLRIIEIAVDMGIKKVRLTGGEPLVRRDIVSFIERLTAIDGLDDIRLTTNGILLPEYGQQLYDCGIRKLNISLDTLRPERYARITGRDYFHRVWEGIRLAGEIGFSPIKLNVVALRHVNDDELADFARLAMERDIQVRFIEFMPIGDDTAWEKEKYISTTEMLARLADLGDLQPVAAARMDGPARIYRFAGSRGSLGFISPISHKFCDRCNRLRLTAEGRLRPCLLIDEETDIKQLIRAGATDDDIRRAIALTILKKPQSHALPPEGGGNCHGRMSRIGG